LREGLLDVACLEAEVAAQLAVKGVIVKLGFTPPRVHSVRRLLGFLMNVLGEGEAKDLIREFIRNRRAMLIILERCREAGQYSSTPVDYEEARIAVEAAREVVSLAERVWGVVLEAG